MTQKIITKWAKLFWPSQDTVNYTSLGENMQSPQSLRHPNCKADVVASRAVVLVCIYITVDAIQKIKREIDCLFIELSYFYCLIKPLLQFPGNDLEKKLLLKWNKWFAKLLCKEKNYSESCILYSQQSKFNNMKST